MFSRNCFMLICQQTHKSHRNYHLITVKTTLHCIKQDKKRKKAFSYLFYTHLAITISAMMSAGRLVHKELKFFFIKHELHVNG